MNSHEDPIPDGMEWDAWPPTKFPCLIVEEFDCPSCKERRSYQDMMADERDPIEQSNFDFRCSCGFYCRKFWNIPREFKHRMGWKFVNPA